MTLMVQGSNRADAPPVPPDTSESRLAWPRKCAAKGAEALKITPASANKLARRKRWPRVPGNDGKARVSVPEEALVRRDSPRIAPWTSLRQPPGQSGPRAPRAGREAGERAWRRSRGPGRGKGAGGRGRGEIGATIRRPGCRARDDGEGNRSVCGRAHEANRSWAMARRKQSASNASLGSLEGCPSELA
jgi:hypothetical protein